MDVVGLWFEDAKGADLAAAIEAAGYAVSTIVDGAALSSAVDGLVADAAILSRHAAVVASHKAGLGPTAFPVLAVLPVDADEAAVVRALVVADEVVRLPVVPAELVGRLRLLLALRRATLAALELDDRRLRADAALEAATVDQVGRVAAQQKDLERQLAHALKMESLGQLAAGIAHEINTPVQYVGGNLEFLANTFGRLVELLDRLSAVALEPEAERHLVAVLADLIGDEELRFLLEETPAAIRESREGLDRVAAIVLSMKRFAHPDLEAPRPVDVGEAIMDTLAVSRSAWKYVADVETDIEPDLPLVSFVAGDFHQVLLNIVVNAAQAIEEKLGPKGGKGHIVIRAALCGRAVEVAVRDTGAGIPEAVRSRVFDPFFTTKEVGKGTGQGLAIVHAIMARHHARLDFVSQPGEGTTFVLTLPLAGLSQLTA